MGAETAKVTTSPQVKRLMAMRFLLYTGFQSSYFIGVVGTLTYSEGASVVSTSLAVLFMNVAMILGSFAGGFVLDALGPRRHFFSNVAGVILSGAILVVFGAQSAVLLVGAALIGFMIGYSQVTASSYPAYLTDSPRELQKINSMMTTLSNVSIIVGPMLGGAVAGVFGSLAVFPLMMMFAAVALIPGWGFQPLRGAATASVSDAAPEKGAPRAPLSQGFKTVFASPLLFMLLSIMFLTNFGYGALDPLESFFYRDVLHVGVEWMGILSSASGVGAVVGAFIVMRLPSRLINLKALLAALALMGVGCLVYVGTPYVLVSLAGQIALGVAFGAINPLHSTIVQTSVPLDQLGRVNSVMLFGNTFAGVAPLAIAPWLASVFGVQGTLLLASCIVTVVPLLLLLFGRGAIERVSDSSHR